jgi:hypothetical protein
MPSISGLTEKISAVLAHVPDDVDAQAAFSELRRDMVRFAGDSETREQAERRIITNGIDNIGHSNCSYCSALLSLL